VSSAWVVCPDGLAAGIRKSTERNRVTLGIYSHVIGDAQRRAVEKVAGILDYSGLQTELESELIQ